MATHIWKEHDNNYARPAFDKKLNSDMLPRISPIPELADRSIPVGITAQQLKSLLTEFARKIYPEQPEKAYKVFLFSPLMLSKDASELKDRLSMVKPMVKYSLNNIFPGMVRDALSKNYETIDYLTKQLISGISALNSLNGKERFKESVRLMTILNMLSVSFLDNTYDQVNPPQLAYNLKSFLNLKIDVVTFSQLLTFGIDASLAILGKYLYTTPPRQTDLSDFKKIKNILKQLQF